MKPIDFRPMEHNDYSGVFALWESCQGIGLGDSDTEPGIHQFLDRNPGLSHVACEGDRIVGAVLCGDDGRRGYIHHLSVHPSNRRRGVGRILVTRCLAALARRNIHKCHLFIFRDNQEGMKFWLAEGWSRRDDLHVMSKSIIEE
ncbi:MAG: GNAT family N-acetyltransferase [Anaerolineales bacterium]|jgi:ribosomal protein S18 acetylase RimI-like enzyme